MPGSFRQLPTFAPPWTHLHRSVTAMSNCTRWPSARVRKLTLADAAGRPYAVECHVVFSLGGPFAVEVWQAIPGTPLDMPEAGGVHHIGYWVDDLAAEGKRLRGPGRAHFAPAGTPRGLTGGPAGPFIELCDLPSDRPSRRALFPPGSEFAGEPLLDSAL